jgi:hypothetical protein
MRSGVGRGCGDRDGRPDRDVGSPRANTVLVSEFPLRGEPIWAGPAGEGHAGEGPAGDGPAWTGLLAERTACAPPTCEVPVWKG